MTRLNPSASPPEGKVVAQTNYAAATGVLTWVLLTVFHVTLPAEMSAFLPVAVSVVVGGIAGWSAKHTPRLDEVAYQVTEALRGGFGSPYATEPPLPPLPDDTGVHDQ